MDPNPPTPAERENLDLLDKFSLTGGDTIVVTHLARSCLEFRKGLVTGLIRGGRPPLEAARLVRIGMALALQIETQAAADAEVIVSAFGDETRRPRVVSPGPREP